MDTVGEFPRRLTSLDLGKMRWLGGRQAVGLDDRAEFASSIPYVSGALENRRLTIVDLGVNGYRRSNTQRAIPGTLTKHNEAQVLTRPRASRSRRT